MTSADLDFCKMSTLRSHTKLQAATAGTHKAKLAKECSLAIIQMDPTKRILKKIF